MVSNRLHVLDSDGTLSIPASPRMISNTSVGRHPRDALREAIVVVVYHCKKALDPKLDNYEHCSLLIAKKPQYYGLKGQHQSRPFPTRSNEERDEHRRATREAGHVWAHTRGYMQLNIPCVGLACFQIFETKTLVGVWINMTSIKLFVIVNYNLCNIFWHHYRKKYRQKKFWKNLVKALN